MLCYRCGSYNADGSRKCSVCGQAFAAQRRASKNLTVQAAAKARLTTPFEPGMRIGSRYRVVSAVAQGAAGWVLRARDEDVDVDVALKVISPNMLQAEEERAAFQATVKLARAVQHPNVVRLYDDGRDDRHVYYTMAYLEGLTLRKIIDLRLDKVEVFSIAEALPLFGQLALGLDNFDSYGAHGALRPSNIMVLPDILKITGVPHFLGLPRRPFVAQQAARGALEYLAPEARREGSIDSRADVYSLAVIFAEMVTGQVFGRDPLSWTRSLRQLPRALAVVVNQALSERPDDRQPSPGGFFDALAEAVADLQFEDSDTAPAAGEVAPVVLQEESTQADGKPAFASRPEPVDGAVDEDGLVASPQVEPPVGPTHLGDFGAVQRTAGKGGFSERRGRQPARKSSSWTGLLLVAVLLAGVAVVAALWWRQQGGELGLQPVADTTVAAPAAVIEGGSRDGVGTTEKVESPAKGGALADDAAPQPTQDESNAAEERHRGAHRNEERRRDGANDGEKRADKNDKLSGSGAGSNTPERQPIKPAHLEHDLPPPPEPPPLVAGGAGSTSEPERTCPAGMVEISGGVFLMGSGPKDSMRGFGELGEHRAAIDPYCIDIFEYPNQRGRQPQAGVSWARAKQACERQGKRLCSEAEWEYACKGKKNLRFPFGNDYSSGACNIGEGGASGKKIAPAGDFGRCRSSFGVLDLAGNVAEWTASRWSADVPDKVVKGGAADQASYTGRCAARVNEAAGGKNGSIGFRCCADLNK